jgi:hypothetical protein
MPQASPREHSPAPARRGPGLRRPDEESVTAALCVSRRADIARLAPGRHRASRAGPTSRVSRRADIARLAVHHYGRVRACRLRRPYRPRRPAVRPRGGGTPRPRGPRRLGARRRPRRGAQPPRPVVATRCGPRRRRPPDDPRLRRRRGRPGRERGRRPRRDRRPRRGRRGRDARPEAVPAEREVPGNARRAGDGPQAEPRPEAGRAVVRRGGLPAHRVAHRVPDARDPRPAARGRYRARPGCRRGSGDRGHRHREGPRRHRVRDQPRRREARACRAARRDRAGDGGTAARARRRGRRDGRPGHDRPLDQVAEAGRPLRHLGLHERPPGHHRPAPGVLPPAGDRRLHDGYAGRARGAPGALCRHRPAPGDRLHLQAGRCPERFRAPGVRRRLRQDRPRVLTRRHSDPN